MTVNLLNSPNSTSLYEIQTCGSPVLLDKLLSLLTPYKRAKGQRRLPISRIPWFPCCGLQWTMIESQACSQTAMLPCWFLFSLIQGGLKISVQVEGTWAWGGRCVLWLYQPALITASRHGSCAWIAECSKKRKIKQRGKSSHICAIVALGTGFEVRPGCAVRWKTERRGRCILFHASCCHIVFFPHF